MVDANNREVLNNSSVKPTDRRISGTISLDLPANRLGLKIVAYRGGGAWLPYLPAVLIVFLTLIASATLFQLRRHAHRRAETEEQLRAAYAFRQAMSQSLITGLRAIDLEGRITFVNAAFCRMTGFNESELVGVAPPYPLLAAGGIRATRRITSKPRWPATPRPAVSRCGSCARTASASTSASISRR